MRNSQFIQIAVFLCNYARYYSCIRNQTGHLHAPTHARKRRQTPNKTKSHRQSVASSARRFVLRSSRAGSECDADSSPPKSAKVLLDTVFFYKYLPALWPRRISGDGLRSSLSDKKDVRENADVSDLYWISANRRQSATTSVAEYSSIRKPSPLRSNCLPT